MKILAVLTVRNEGAFLLEWLAHHRAAGITDFIVCSNDCTDGTDRMLDRLEALGWLTHLRNAGPYGKKGVQFTALRMVDDHSKLREADWILPIDIDEFVNVHVGNHKLPDLIDTLSEASAITLTWRLFGNGGVVRYDDQPVTQTFTRCAPEIINWPWRAAMFKTLFRNDGTYAKLGVHRPRAPDRAKLARARWFDGNGRELDDAFKTKRVFSNFGQPNHRLVQLNHYPLGSMESYVLKSDRGRVNHSDDPMGLDYWVERNFNSDQDSSIDALSDHSAPLLADLKQDSTLSELHAAAVSWRKDRFDALMRSEPSRALFGRLLMTAPSKALTGHSARFLLNYALKDIQNGDN
ncbi:glycosyltransferase family 2 protein [uncultured Roseobacter sp.]|uniref:glycosyltransferase family 2 protein n=1 Tax=uncultured Roseobacter sp. TaxID=114847 RepID=UPI0026022997|nr:glycosyltransferase family 2 protein [uncultured Roseobacter sp.]